MCIVVDANVWFDLHCGGLHIAALSLGDRIRSVDIVVEQQLLASPSGEELRQGGLYVEVLPPEGVLQAQAWRGDHIELEVADVFSLALASLNQWTLATRDGPLTTLAKAEGVPVIITVELISTIAETGVLTIADINKFKKGMYQAGRPYDKALLNKAEHVVKSHANQSS